MSNDANLGNLAQAARGNQLKSARWIMIVIGILTLAANGFFFATARQTIDAEVAKLRQQGMQVDVGEIENAVRTQQLVCGTMAVLGIVFIVLGILVYKFPVPCTVAGLSLYLLSTLVFAVLDPTQIARGVIIKVFIVIGLFKSVKSAMAYQAERKAEQASSNSNSGFSIT